MVQKNMQIAQTFLDQNRNRIDAFVKAIGDKHPDVLRTDFPAFMVTKGDQENTLSLFAEKNKLSPLETFALGTLMSSDAATATFNHQGEPRTNQLMEEVGDLLIHIGARPWSDKIDAVSETVVEHHKTQNRGKPILKVKTAGDWALD